MFTKLYEKIKKFIINNYRGLIILGIVIFLCFFELPFVIYTPGGIVELNNRVKIEDGYKSDGTINMSYVSMVKGNVPLLLASFVIPNWDIVAKKNITYNNESISDLLEYERLQMKMSIANATLVAYNKAEKEVTVSNSVFNIVAVTNESKTNVQRFDELLKIDNQEIKSLEDIRNIVQSCNVGDKVSLLVLRDGKETNCEAIIYEENDNKYMGISFLQVYDYETNPPVEVKTKSSEAGASGGLMMSLAIYNALVEEDITGGRKVVGTGTIGPDGLVGAIDGVKYKLLGAVKNKADMFICPKENYEEAIKYKKELNLNIDIYGVETFDEALSILQK